MTNNEKDIDLGEAGETLVEDHLDPQAVPLASTPIDLAQLGLNQIAYIRRAVVDDMLVWSIHSAAGTPMGAAENLEQAWGAVMQHNLEPVHVH
jgi:hypothetical protein